MESDGKQLVKDIFVLRLWRNVDDPLFWRGEVQHVNSGEAQYIHSAGDLLDYLQQQLAQPGEQPADKKDISGLR